MAIKTTMQTLVQSMYINLQNPIHSLPITCRTTNKNKYEKKQRTPLEKKSLLTCIEKCFEYFIFFLILMLFVPFATPISEAILNLVFRSEQLLFILIDFGLWPFFLQIFLFRFTFHSIMYVKLCYLRCRI